ncbi:MAG: KTSC domain-containing protein [Acidobacteria bacterium]|nr:KTSC domain-containing protein [Acidobacteriota bacterium]
MNRCYSFLDRLTMYSRFCVFLIFIAFSCGLGCSSRDCSQLPKHFRTYSEAHSIISHTRFYYEDSVRTWKSSWIRRASYYSCDGKLGFFVLDTNGRTYIHSGVPIELWFAFVKARSYGSFYNRYLKGRYRLKGLHRLK